MRYTLFFYCVILFLYSCKDDNARKFGIDYNGERSRLKMPLLNSKWVLTKIEINKGENNYRWSNMEDADSLSFITKLIRIKEGVLTTDENSFVGSRKYKTIDGEFKEQLYITFVRDENTGFKNYTWNCEYRGPGFEFGKKVNKAEADSILMIWNINPYSP